MMLLIPASGGRLCARNALCERETMRSAIPARDKSLANSCLGGVDAVAAGVWRGSDKGKLLIRVPPVTESLVRLAVRGRYSITHSKNRWTCQRFDSRTTSENA